MSTPTPTIPAGFLTPPAGVPIPTVIADDQASSVGWGILQWDLANGRVVRSVWMYDNDNDYMRRTIVVYEVNNANAADPLTQMNVRLGAPSTAATHKLVGEFAKLP